MKSYVILCLKNGKKKRKKIFVFSVEGIVDVEHLLKRPVMGIPRLTDDQSSVIRASLKQPFTVIQGPAASGKSLIASYLAYLFSQHNAAVNMNHLVLLCGPTDQSLDVLTGMAH